MRHTMGGRAAAATLLAFSIPILAEGEPVRAPGAEDRVVVTATRVADVDAVVEEVPAHVTVLDREHIERSGARTLQDLLAAEAGIVVFDQVGNAVETTFDLRGFRGSGCAVYLDDVRLNDPRNNGLSLETVPIDAVERVEIVRGSAAAVAGAGAEAGIVRIQTRRGAAPALALHLATGSDGQERYGVDAGGSLSGFDGFVSASHDDTDGFRENAGGRTNRLAGSVGRTFAAGRLELSLTATDQRWGNPGALTLDEWAADPSAAPYNTLDRSEGDVRFAALRWRGAGSGRFTYVASLGWRDAATEVLSTGRAAAAGFGGFFLDSDTSAWNAAAQGTWRAALAGRENTLSVGVEALDGTTDALGWFTPPEDPGSVDRANPSAVNAIDRRTAAVYAHDSWKVSPKWTLTAGARFDRDRLAYDEAVPDPTLADARTFSETSLRAGAVFAPAPSWTVYGAYGEGFLPPTVEQLFAFPTFGSNPDLEPERSRSIEAGARFRRGGASVDAALFRIDTQDEIVFDPDSPLGPFGANVNAGRTRRRGFELSARAPFGTLATGRASVTRVDARFRNGAAAGNTVPLVPGWRASAGLGLRLPGRVELGLEAQYVDDQVLDNDDANAQQRLPGYTIANARLAWSPAFARERSEEPLTLYVEMRNLFDREYATRGIYALDFTTFENAVFVTPAPGRRVLFGLAWRP
ncbi:MAG TPA: TonB-dependent receptor [Candidatus Polarisedimenticolaceae bacterium]